MQLYLGGYLDFYNPQPGRWLEVELKQPARLSGVLAELEIPIEDVQSVCPQWRIGRHK